MQPDRINRIPRRPATPAPGSHPTKLRSISIAVVLAAVAAIVIAACGGGTDEAPKQPTPDADCKAKPEACK